jgi:hypothetical protein
LALHSRMCQVHRQSSGMIDWSGTGGGPGQCCGPGNSAPGCLGVHVAAAPSSSTESGPWTDGATSAIGPDSAAPRLTRLRRHSPPEPVQRPEPGARRGPPPAGRRAVDAGRTGLRRAGEMAAGTEPVGRPTCNFPSGNPSCSSAASRKLPEPNSPGPIGPSGRALPAPWMPRSGPTSCVNPGDCGIGLSKCPGRLSICWT